MMNTVIDHYLEQLVMFDSLTFRMQKEEMSSPQDDDNEQEEQQEQVDDEEEREGEKGIIENDLDGGGSVGGDVGGDGGGDVDDIDGNDLDDDDDVGEGDQVISSWLKALRMMLSHGYSIHGDHFDPFLVPSLFDEGIWVSSQDQDQDDNSSSLPSSLHQKVSSLHAKDKGKGKGKDEDQDFQRSSSKVLVGMMRMYSCQQSLMKMHPLFDHAIVKVPFCYVKPPTSYCPV
jgi:hypothetical protein